MTETPHNTEAEQQVLGSILLDNSVFDLVGDLLSIDHFFDPVHKRIFHICANRIGKGHLASPVTLKTIMEGDEGLKQLGGPAYLARMAGAAISKVAARDYAKSIVEAAVRRRLFEAANGALAGLKDGSEGEEVKIGLLNALSALPESSGGESTISLLKAMTKAVGQANEAFQGNTSFLKTGIDALDAILKGMGPGDVMLLGGATSMGKTATALEICAKVAIEQRLPCAFWSLEMEDDQLATRMASAVARIPYSALRDAGTMEGEDFKKWVDAGYSIAKSPFQIVPKHIRDIAAGHAALRQAARKLGGKLSLIVIDYVQLIRGTGKSRYEQMTEVSIGIKAMAGLMGCPVIGLVQLDRKIGEREDRRPHLFDIKETGQFENDADQVVFCHREEHWLEVFGPKPNKSGEITNEARADYESDLKSVRNTIELIVRKNRHGKKGIAKAGFHAPTNRFWRLEERGSVQDEF